MSLGIVQKESCITEESNRKKSFYRVDDLLFRFWCRFVPLLRKKGSAELTGTFLLIYNLLQVIYFY
jgi:hypothetical protein